MKSELNRANTRGVDLSRGRIGSLARDPLPARGTRLRSLRGLDVPGLLNSEQARPAVSVVLPVLNEAQSLPIVIEGIERALDACVGPDYEIVFVDDGSDDDSWRIVSRCAASRRRRQALRFSRRFGHQAALLAGLAASRGRAVITLDSDGQHPPECLPLMIERWRAGARTVQMVRRESPDAPRLKRVTSRLFYRAFAALCDVPIRAAAADFRLMDRSVVDLVVRSGGPTPFLRGLIPWLGFDAVEIEYEPRPRVGGVTKYSFRRMVRLALDGLLNFSIVPLRLGIWTGLTFGLLSFVYLCYVAAVGLFSERAVPGWASTAGLVALLGGVQLFCVGLLGEYLGRLYLAQLDRPRYVVAEAAGMFAEVDSPSITSQVDTALVSPIDAPTEPAHVG